MAATPSRCCAARGRRSAYYATRAPSPERNVLVTITAMPAFAHLSVEELRYDQQRHGGDVAASLEGRTDAEDRDDVCRCAAVARDYRDFGRVLHCVAEQDGPAKLSFEELRYLDDAKQQNPEQALAYEAWVDASPVEPISVVSSWRPRAPTYRPSLLDKESEASWPFLVAITAMNEFAGKSFEELRLEDRNAPVAWLSALASVRRPPVVPLMELRMRKDVGRVMDETPRWWELCVERDHAERLLRPLMRDWCKQEIQETTTAWYPALEHTRFRAYIEAAARTAHTNGGVWDEPVPVSLVWMEGYEIFLSPVSAEKQLLQLIDPFALIGYYCAQSRLVTTSATPLNDLDWPQVRREILEGIGGVAMSLVSRLLQAQELEHIDEATTEAIAEVLHVQESRSTVLKALRYHTRRVHNYMRSCEQLAIDTLTLRSREAVARHHTPQAVIETTVDSVFVCHAHESSGLSEAMRHEIERLPRESNPGSRDWLCAQYGQVLRIVDPLLAAIDPHKTRRVPALTEHRYTKTVDPYQHMSEIAFQNGIPMPMSLAAKWLPSNVAVLPNGEAVFASYIHNLHPKTFRKLYQALERVLTYMIPSFESVVWSLKRGCPVSPWFGTTGVPQVSYVHDCLAPRPEPPSRPYPQAHPQPTLWSLKATVLQVAVCVEEISVSAAQPWLSCWESDIVSRNGTVAAAGVYCYGSANIAAASLVLTSNGSHNHAKYPHLPRDPKSLAAIYGVHADEPFVTAQTSSISLREGKSVVWPSMYKARVERVKWSDLSGKGDPGSLKLVWFYLVTPGTGILSTADVPPIQAKWSTIASDELAHKFQLPDPVMELIMAFSSPHHAHRNEPTLRARRSAFPAT